MGLLYGHTGRLTAETAVSGPGRGKDICSRERPDAAARGHAEGLLKNCSLLNQWLLDGNNGFPRVAGRFHVLEGLSVWRDIWDEDLSGAGLRTARYRDRETIKARIILYEQELIIMNRRDNRF